MLVGLGAGFAPSAQAASSAPSSSLVLPVQVQEAEKPDVWIETNVVLNTQKKPTGYVELVLKARTPTIYFADNEMTQLRYPGDGLETQAGRWNGTAFSAEDPETYAASRQTTFREVAASLQYNTKVLVPVSWEHEIEYGEGADINVIQNAYPDFFAKYYVDESSLMKPGADGNLGTNDDVPMEGEERSAEIRRQFAESKNQQRIAVPTLQYSTKSVSSAVSYAGGPDGLISMAVNSNADTVLPQESALAVVRFLYIGEEPIEHLLDKNSDPKIGYTVNSNKVSSWHNIQNGGSNKGDGAVNDFFWFADDTLIKQSTVQQALIYTSGKYQENIGVESDKISGINQFYATKSIYNGDEISEDQRPTYTMATVPGYVKNPTNSSEQNYTEVTPEEDTSATPTKIHRPKTDAENITVLAAARKDGDRPFSYTSNLLFTTDRGAELVDGSNENIAFTLRAGPTYKSSGGGTVDDFAAVVFIDWDDTMLGALVVPKGDARDRVEEYVEKFIHPTLRKSTAMAMDDGPAKTERLFNLSRSLDRKYTYAGNHTSDYATLAAVGGSYSEAEAAMSTDTTYLGKTIFPDGYIVDDVDMAGSSYPLTNKLDYSILRRPVDWENTQTIAAGVEGSPYVDKNGNSVAATEWVLGAIDYDGTQTPETVDDNYWYTNCWAVVKQPSKVSDVWTTFSTTGELSEAKLPAFDSTTVAAGGHAYDGLDYFNADYIRATGDATPDANMPAGTAVAATANAAGNGEMAFATYADSAYFEFADFADVKVDELFVKACYEPCEQLSWNNDYTIITEPYYVRYGTAGSTEAGSVYSISFDYERIDSMGNAVQRIRSPWTRVQYTMDKGEEAAKALATLPAGQKVEYAGSNFFVGVVQKSTDVITANFTPTSTFLSMNYGVIEVYGWDNFAVGVARSLVENEANVETNFNYRTDTSLPESWKNGFNYNNRLGTYGYVYIATINQVLEKATELFSGRINMTDQEFINTYLKYTTLMDLNLRLDEDGMLADGSNTDDIDAYLDNLEETQQAIFDALRIGYKYISDKEVIDLEWHQLQYHILHWKEATGGIETAKGLRTKEECGSFAWCRQDECAETVTVPVTTLEEALKAVQLSVDTTVTDNRREAAKKALKENLVAILTSLRIYKTNTDSGGVAFGTIDDIASGGTYGEGDFNNVYQGLVDLVAEVSTKGDDLESLLPIQVQKWLMNIDGGTRSYELQKDSSGGTDDSEDWYIYWWFKFKVNPVPVVFTGTGVNNAIERLVEAVYAAGKDENPRAWNNVTDATIDTITGGMRFRSDERGDFFDETARNNFIATTGIYTQTSVEYDWRTESNVLDGFSDSAAFISDVTVLVESVSKNADESWIEQNTAAGLLSWEEFQYYFINKSEMPATSKAGNYYTGTENGQYWWKNNDIRFNEVKKATYTDKEGNNITRPTNTTMDDLRAKLANYAAGNNQQREDLAARFKIWFTQETAIDLVVKSDRYGGGISSSNIDTINATADRLLRLANDYKQNNTLDVSFRELTWSQVQYYLINDTYATTKGAQSFTHSVNCTWGDNAWREPKRESITELKALIEAIDKGGSALSSIENLSDLEIPKLYFKIEKLHSDLAGKTPTEIFTQMKEKYVEKSGEDWSKLTEAANLDSAWYLIQYYLYNGEFVEPKAGESVLKATAAEGKLVYWWKDGWDGITSFEDSSSKLHGLVNTIQSGVKARLVELKNRTYTLEEISSLTKNIRIPEGGGWVDIADAAMELYGKRLSSTNVWNYLQFIVLHKVQYPDDDDEGSAYNSADKLAIDEANSFYWWYDNRTSTHAINMPTKPSSDEASDWVTWRKQASAAILEAELRKIAANDTVAGNIVTGTESDGTTPKLVNKVEQLNIRIPDPDKTKRSELLSYSDEEKLRAALDALIKQVYLDNVSGEPAGYEKDKWKYIDEKGVFTYNAAAYVAACDLDPYQIQHWLVTYNDGAGVGDYNPDGDTRASYWWIDTDELKGEVTFEQFEQFFIKLVAYWYNYSDYDSFEKLVLAEWDNYGFSLSASDVINNGYYDAVDIADMVSGGRGHWAMLELILNEWWCPDYDTAVGTYTYWPDGFDQEITITEDILGGIAPQFVFAEEKMDGQLLEVEQKETETTADAEQTEAEAETDDSENEVDELKAEDNKTEGETPAIDKDVGASDEDIVENEETEEAEGELTTEEMPETEITEEVVTEQAELEQKDQEGSIEPKDNNAEEPEMTEEDLQIEEEPRQSERNMSRDSLTICASNEIMTMHNRVLAAAA